MPRQQGGWRFPFFVKGKYPAAAQGALHDGSLDSLRTLPLSGNAGAALNYAFPAAGFFPGRGTIRKDGTPERCEVQAG